jgi:tetratricopeptide (TPR) repeat protein
MAVVECFMVDGVKYIRNGASFAYGETYEMIVMDSEREKVKEAYYNGIELDTLSQSDLKDYIKYAKMMGEYERAKKALLFACEKYLYDEDFMKTWFPSYLSNTRKEIKEQTKAAGCTQEKRKEYLKVLQNDTRAVREVVEKYLEYQSVAIYTSLLAAYLDFGDLESAKSCAEKAKRLNGQKDNAKLKEALNRLERVEDNRCT